MRLMKKDRDVIKNVESTFAIDADKWKYTPTWIVKKQPKVTFLAWDFAGQVSELKFTFYLVGVQLPRTIAVDDYYRELFILLCRRVIERIICIFILRGLYILLFLNLMKVKKD